MNEQAWSRDDFVAQLKKVGAMAYHDKHPFHIAMNSGGLDRSALRAWVANRFYYQRNIPIKDAAILSNCPVREVRRIWIHRILDHDGAVTTSGGLQSAQLGKTSALGTPLLREQGGIEAWLRVGQACGLSRADLVENRHLLPGVRFA